MFLQASVILLTGGVSADTPGADTPWSRYPLEQTPPGADIPQSRHPPEPPGADSSIRSTSGQYTSYWNAFLFQKRVSRILSTGGVCVAGGHA